MYQKAELIKTMDEFVLNSPLNEVKGIGDFRIYDAPIFGFSSADDKLFLELKRDEVVRSGHMSPKEWLPEAKTVISYFLPFSQEVREKNYADIYTPAVEWLYGRVEGEVFNNELRRFIIKYIDGLGGSAIAPNFDPRYSSVNRKSNWSERHVAYISGLGTFNLNKSILTEKGSAGRLGSIIVSLEYEPTIRKYKDIYEYCNNCGACIRRCPVQAISKDGKDHEICGNYLDETKVRFAPRYGCGKCQTKVPCENSIPKKA